MKKRKEEEIRPQKKNENFDNPGEMTTRQFPEELKKFPVEAIKGIMTSETSIFYGPLPSPGTLAEYKENAPEAYDIILKMVYEHHTHQIDCDKEVIKILAKKTDKGQIFGFIITICAMMLAVLCGYMEQPILGGALLGSGLVGIVGLFLGNKLRGNKDDKKSDDGEEEEENKE